MNSDSPIGKSGQPDDAQQGLRLLNRMQGFDDAIAWRRARTAEPCPDCDLEPDGERCDDHAVDLALIATYERRLREADLELGHRPILDASDLINDEDA
jgi:hypothetical protein